MAAKILIVEDEPSIADNIVYALSTEGFEPQWCSTGGAAMEEFERLSHDLIVLDVGLPDINGFEVARRLLARGPVPLIFLTARSDEIDRVVGLELGADDYVVKPFSPRELSARVKAVLRRSGSEVSGPRPLENDASGFSIDDRGMSISYHGSLLELSRTEYFLLRVLVRSPGRVYTREQLMDSAWQHSGASMERTVDTHIKTIRRKLRSVVQEPDPIVTHRGIGYSLRR